MSSIGSFTNAVRLINDAAARAVPHVLPERHVFTQYLFPFISTFFDVSDPKLGPGQQKFKTPGSVASRSTYQIQPKIYDFGTMVTNFTTNGSAVQAVADTDSTIVLTVTTGIRKYDLLRNRRTGAVIQARSVSGFTVTYRGFTGGSVGGGLDAINAGDKYDFVGNAYPDGATLQAGNKGEPTERSNYIQFHVDETDIGWLAQKRKLYPDEMNSHQTDELTNAIRHNEGRERAFLFGAGDLVTIAGELIHAMKGLDAWSDVEYDAGGSITMDEWRTVISPIVFQAGGGGRKKGLAGNTVLSAFDALLDGKTVFQKPTDEYSIRLKTVEAASGIVDLMGSQPMHEREGEVFFYDPDLMTRLYLDGFDTVMLDGLAPNNVLKMTNGLFTCETLLVHNPESIVKVTNILA